MPKLAIIGYGAMAGYLAQGLPATSWQLAGCVIRAGREAAARDRLGPAVRLSPQLDPMLAEVALVVDCAGHEGLRAHGPAVLRAGVPLLTASVGALADPALHDALEAAAVAGGTQLIVASGAIGALDALTAARVGGLEEVTYEGRKPPAGWRGTPAEAAEDLDALTAPLVHFTGTAREAALRYPKNANVAAAVALAGAGFEATQVRLVADPDATGNTHRITARGAFGRLDFSITGASLPDTPRTSALAAMSMLAGIARRDRWLVI